MADQVVSPTTPVTAPSPAAPPHSSNKTALYVILVVVLLLLASVGSYLLGQQSGKQTVQQPTSTAVPYPTVPPISPTPKETAEWKTYASDGLNFKYPSEWKIVTGLNATDPNWKDIRLSSPEINGQCTVEASLSVADCKSYSYGCETNYQIPSYSIVATLPNGLKVGQWFGSPYNNPVFLHLINQEEAPRIRMPNGKILEAGVGFCQEKTTLTTEQQMQTPAFLQGLDILKSVTFTK